MQTTLTYPVAAPRSPSPLVARAAAMVPKLAERAVATNAARRLLPENVTLLHEAELTRILRPKRSGGREDSLRVHLDCVAEIARGCGSTAWCLGVYHAHQWLLGLYEARAQDEVYDAAPNALIAAALGPLGTARPVSGGWRLSGTWGFCSGVHPSAWVMLGARMLDAGGQQIDDGALLLPVSDITIKDDWYMAGLSGTGSNTVEVRDVHVPAHRFLSFPKAISGERPGADLHATALYRSAMVPALALFICGPAIGMARRALEAFVARLPGRVVSYTFGAKQAELPVTHAQVAESASRIDHAHLLLNAVIDDIERFASRHEPMPIERRAKARMDCASAVKLCLEAVETLVYAAGGSALAETSPIQLAARDIRAANTHGLLNHATNLEMYGRVLLGLAPNTPVL